MYSCSGVIESPPTRLEGDGLRLRAVYRAVMTGVYMGAAGSWFFGVSVRGALIAESHCCTGVAGGGAVQRCRSDCTPCHVDEQPSEAYARTQSTIRSLRFIAEPFRAGAGVIHAGTREG